MLNRKAASDAAVRHLAELVPIVSAPIVEEYFFADGVWQITLGYSPAGMGNGSPLEGATPAKEYKTFAIDGRSGEIISMKIRSLKA